MSIGRPIAIGCQRWTGIHTALYTTEYVLHSVQHRATVPHNPAYQSNLSGPTAVEDHLLHRAGLVHHGLWVSIGRTALSVLLMPQYDNLAIFMSPSPFFIRAPIFAHFDS